MPVEQKGQAQHFVPMDEMESFYDEPGEKGWIMEGYKHGFTNSSAIVTETAPRGGPPLHTHYTEEIHVLPAKSRVAYVMGDSRCVIEGPGLMRIPAGIPHTFLNIGDLPIRLVCFFPSHDFWNNYVELGANPLLDEY
jgi:quercetin dioxygenase-like cupin family protein